MSYIVKCRDSVAKITMFYHGSGWSTYKNDAKIFRSQKDAESVVRQYSKHKEKGKKFTAEKYEKEN